MKKRILLTGLLVVLVAALSVGLTMAYLQDSETKTNTFTVGNVDITLNEVFKQDAKLLPGIDVEKAVDVTNVGSEDAYVRVHIAVPSMLDSGSEDEPEFAAYNNTLHWNFTGASLADGLWNWNADVNGANYPGNGGAWNMYPATIDGVLYNVYVATYETALAQGETTAQKAITKVYLDTKVTNEDLAAINAKIGQIKVLVAAEGVQAAGFTNAYEALNKAFGVPGTYDVKWTVAE